MVPMGAKFCPQVPPNETGKKIDLYVKSQRQTVKLWPKKDKFSILLGGGLHPLGSSKFAGDGSYGPKILRVRSF